MASLYFAVSVIFLLFCSTATSFAQENSTSPQAKNTSTGYNVTTIATNRRMPINLTSCELRVDRSKIKEVLGKQYNDVASINTVKIRVLVYSGNNTEHSQEMELSWASEVGRTIISLVQRAKEVPLLRSLLLTTILEVGTDKVDIEIKEETKECLPIGELWSEHIFNFLLRQLSHSDDAHAFKLCKAHKEDTTQYTTFNCCKIIGDRNLALCGDYSSVVVNWAFPCVVVIFCISCLIFVPFLLQYAISYQKKEFYKVSDSPMSLLSIASVILFEGQGPFKSLFRRCLFAGLTYFMVFFPRFFGVQWLNWVFLSWVIIFCFCDDVEMTNDEVNQDNVPRDQCMEKCSRCMEKCNRCMEKCNRNCKFEEKLISCFTIPLFLPLSWAPNLFSSRFETLRGNKQKLSRDTARDTESTPRTKVGWKNNFLNVFQGLWILFAISLSLIGYFFTVLFCLLKFVFIDLILFFIWPHEFGVIVFLRLANFILFVFLIGMTFIFILSVIVTLSLNAEFFNPFVAPVLTLLGYFWKNWASSVETKCLDLKTLVIQVSLEKLKGQVPISGNDQENISPEPISGNDGASATCNNKSTGKVHSREILEFLCPCLPSTESPKTQAMEMKMKEHRIQVEMPVLSYCLPVIKFEKNGEAMISKELYKTMSKRVLHLDHLLFYFFRRVLFVGLYALGMLTVMVLVRESRVSGIVQVIGAIFAALIPFIFDTMFSDYDLSQINCEEVAIRQRLEHMLKATKLDDNAILVEFLDVSDHTQSVESLKDLCEQIAPAVESFIALCKRIEPIDTSNLKCDQDGLQHAEYLVLVLQRITSIAESLVALHKKINAHVRCLVPLDTNVKRLLKQIACTKNSFDTINKLIVPSPDSLKKIAEQFTLTANSLNNIREKVKVYEEFVGTRRVSSVDFLIKISEQITSSADFIIAKCNQITRTAKQLGISPRSQLTESYAAVLERIKQIKQPDTENFSQQQFSTTIRTLVRMSENLEKFLVVTSKSIKETTEPLVPLYQQYLSGPSHPSTSVHTRV